LVISALAVGVWSAAAAHDVPLPHPRPAPLLERFNSSPKTAVSPAAPLSLAPAPELHGVPAPPVTTGPSACEIRLAEIAAYAPLPTLVGPGDCGAPNAVRLEAITLPGGERVALNPPATLRCGLAEAVAHWVREDLAPAAATLGSRLVSIVNYDSYSCRSRNRIVGAKLSEHGKANALDIRALRLAGGVSIEPTDARVSRAFRDTMRRTACARFMTVLGPGSDGYHESHIHVDLAERTRGYRLCHWDLHDGEVASVPLPLPRPTARAATTLPK
jgi:hypothetical protein